MGGRFAVSQPAIERALHFPGCFAERGQAHHAATAFEGVEGPAQIGQLSGVCHIGMQRFNGGERIADDFRGFFQKDVAQIFFFDGGIDDAIFR